MKATCKVTQGWLPLPESVERALGWREGDVVEVEVIEGVVVVTKVSDAEKKSK